MRKGITAAALAVAALGMSAGFFAAQASDAAPTKQVPPRSTANPDIRKRILRSGASGWGARRYPGLGWSVAEDRRRAKKRRNQQRHRATSKRRGR